ncbi:receptor-type tyrosine-protein phosphatase kappa-like [Grus japonensis]|uniref:Receptor-type tyrosine-protein phosphatase kappa-like n=1 Tax=Grus japonensis TaxID=30415 RepID=A0ABC9Y000_GRUJA
MTLQGLALVFVLVLAPQLPAQGQKDAGPKNQRGAKEAGKCPKPQWDERVQFVPSKNSYEENEELTLTCPGDLKPSFSKVKCARELLRVSSGEPVYGDAWWGRNSTSAWMLIERAVECIETCKRPQWDSRLQLAPDKEKYKKNEEVMLSCPAGFQPSFTHIKCLGEDQPITSWNPVYTDPWVGRDSGGDWTRIQSSVECIETCKRPQWDSRLQLAPDEEKYKMNEEVMLSCPAGFQPSFTHVKCAREVQSVSHGKPVYREVWFGGDSGGDWTRIQSSVECIGKCQKPQWDARFIFDPDRGLYTPNEVVKMRCAEGYWSSAVEITCVKLYPRQGSSISHSGWIVRKDTGHWHRIEGNMTCVEDFQVVPGTLEISSTSIKLNWTCRLPDVCQRMRATCRLAVPSSPPCEAEEVKGEEMLHGGEGTFTCPPLQPFTVYSFTISLPPNKVLYTQLITTKESVPDKPEKLWLDPSTGSIKWQPLPSCKGKIIGYQLNITARRAHNGSFLEFKQVMVNQSVTQYTPPHQTPGSKYTVTVQGLTATGAGAASVLEFESYVSELQPYENLDNYCVVKKTLLAEEDAETCKRPRWDSRLQLAPDEEKYKMNEEVMLSCPAGFQPSFTHVKCAREVQSVSHGKPVYREVWLGRDSRGVWIRIRSNVECIEVLQVVPGTLEISSTSIKLNWTCRLPDVCQRMRATCRLAVPSSPPCEAEEVKGEEMLHGGEGTFTCPPLQPFTDYSVTISLPPSTVLFTWLVRTGETVPDKPEKLWLDPSTGSIKWEKLPSCNGEIIGYQLNITAWSAQDGGFLEMQRLRLSSSVTEHSLPGHSPGSSYVVTMQGVTNTGAGAASLWEFQTDSSDTPHPLDISCRSVRDISPSQGTVVLPLRPIARPPEMAREHQLIVVVTHNGTAVEGACSGEPQPFNASQQPGTYVAAVINLTASTDFVLGDRQGRRG